MKCLTCGAEIILDVESIITKEICDDCLNLLTKEHPITKKVMLQYETVRKSSICNMFDYPDVIKTAEALDLPELANLEEENYINILKNFAKFMMLYNIKQ